MSAHSNEQASAPKLSRVRSFLFGAFAVVWISEMALWGFPFLAKGWSNVWHIVPPDNAQLAALMYMIQAIEAPAKGALGVLALLGLRSKIPSTRASLFMAMALVPPLNIAFPFREQGFPLGSVLVGSGFSAILWGSFFLFKERTPQFEPKGAVRSGQRPASRWEIFQYIWFAANSAVLTLFASLFLFQTRTALNLVFSCMSTLLNSSQGDLSSLVRSAMATGTHVFALATASWIATIYSRSNPTLRHAVTAASAVHAGLFFVMPLRQIAQGFGASCAVSSMLVWFAPVLVGWVLYAAFAYRVELKRRQEAYA